MGEKYLKSGRPGGKKENRPDFFDSTESYSTSIYFSRLDVKTEDKNDNVLHNKLGLYLLSPWGQILPTVYS